LRLQREAQAAAQTPAAPPAPVAPAAEKPRPVKQTITTDPRTGQQTMKIEGSVQDLSSANPNTPTVMPPNFDQMLQVESGNRDFDAQGRPIVSPKGARYAAQVMPATARDPGFGVRPAADDTPAESNRVGRDYYQAMLNKYPGQPELARAAYNAGPGAVDAAIQKSMMQGGSPLDYLPKETQGYVQKTAGNVRMQGGKVKVVPPAQQQPPAAAAPAPEPQAVAPAAPEPMAAPEPQSPYSLASGQPSQGLQMPDQAPPPAAMPAMGALPAAQQRFQEIQDDPGALLQYRNDTAIPENLRRRAGERASELLNSERNLARAEARRDELIASGDGKAIANAMQGRGAKGEEGSWLKFVFLRAIDNRMADVEAEKLGILPSKYEQSTIANADGTQTAIEIKKSSSGKIQEAYRMDGTPLTGKELDRLNAGANLDIVGGTFVNDITGEVGSAVRDKRTGQGYIQTDTGRKPMKGFRPQTGSGTAADQRAKLIFEMNTKLQGKAGEEAMAIQREYNQKLVGQGLAPMQPSETPIIAPQIGGGAPAPAPAPAAPAAPAPAPSAVAPAPSDTMPAPAPGAVAPNTNVAATGKRPTLTQIEAQAAGQTEAAKNAPLVRREDEQQFVKYRNDDLLPKAESGSRLSGIRQDQISGPDGILNNPEIAGFLSGTGSSGQEFTNLLRDIVAGNFKDEPEMSLRIRQAALDNPRMKEVLQIQLQRQREVTPLLIREVAPVGAITDFEQRMAKEAGIDVLRQGLYSSLTNLTRSQFQSDVAAYKARFADNNPQLRTRSEFDRAWNQEKARLDASYRKVYEDRARYLGKYNADGKNNNATIVAFRDHYPVPKYDAQTGKFQFRGYAAGAERPPLSSFEKR